MKTENDAETIQLRIDETLKFIRQLRHRWKLCNHLMNDNELSYLRGDIWDCRHELARLRALSKSLPTLPAAPVSAAFRAGLDAVENLDQAE